MGNGTAEGCQTKLISYCCLGQVITDIKGCSIYACIYTVYLTQFDAKMCELTLQMILLCNCSLSLNVCNMGLQCNLQFLSTTVLQGSIATWVNYGKIFNDFFIANLLPSVTVKEFCRSVRIWQSYGKK